MDKMRKRTRIFALYFLLILMTGCSIISLPKAGETAKTQITDEISTEVTTSSSITTSEVITSQEPVEDVDVEQIFSGNFITLAGNWIDGHGNEWVIREDGSTQMNWADGTIDKDSLIVQVQESGNSVIYTWSTGMLKVFSVGQSESDSDSSRPRLLIMKDGKNPLTQKDFFYRQSSTEEMSITQEEETTIPSVSNASKLDVKEIQEGDMSSLAGTWVSEGPIEWVIDEKGMLPGSEIFRLAESWSSEVGISLELTYRSSAHPVLLLPEGIAYGTSDQTKDRLVFFPGVNESYYYRK